MVEEKVIGLNITSRQVIMRDTVIANSSRIGCHVWGSIADSRNATEDFYACGIRWIRSTRPMEMDCALVGPSQYDFSNDSCEEATDRQYNAGFNIMGILDFEHYRDKPFHSPIWEHLAAWEAFVRACVLHYQDRVKYWEVINEPPYGWLMPKPEGAPDTYWERGPISAYAKLLKITAATIRELDAEAVVLCGSSMYDGKFLRLFYEQGCKDDFDIATVHYLHCHEPRQFNAEYDGLRAIMAEYGDADKELWDTENGTSGEIPGKEIKTEIEIPLYQGYYNVYRHCLTHASGLQRYFWYNPVGNGKDLIAVRDEQGEFTPPYRALQVMTDCLGESHLLCHRSFDDACHVYVFDAPQGPISVVWATTPSLAHFPARHEAIDVWGNPLILQHDQPIKEIPLYIEGNLLQDGAEFEIVPA